MVVPIGARSKEHGRHLPMCTDYLVARAFCDGIAAALPVLIAPVIDFGYYPAFLRYPGSQHLRAETFIALLTDIFERLLDQGAANLAIVNTGVSTEGADPDRRARSAGAARRRRPGRGYPPPRAAQRVRSSEQKLGGHGDEHETSLMLAIAPERVNMSKARRPITATWLEQPPSVFVSPTQFRNDPTGRHPPHRDRRARRPDAGERRRRAA